MLRRQSAEGDPVYRRLPDGRIRFEWSVAQQLRAEQREALRETQPLPRMPHPDRDQPWTTAVCCGSIIGEPEPEGG